MTCKKTKKLQSQGFDTKLKVSCLVSYLGVKARLQLK